MFTTVKMYSEVKPSRKTWMRLLATIRVTLTTNIIIGCHVQINLGCTVSHDAVVREYPLAAERPAGAGTDGERGLSTERRIRPEASSRLRQPVNFHGRAGAKDSPVD